MSDRTIEVNPRTGLYEWTARFLLCWCHMTLEQRKKALEAGMTRLCGFPVEITIRAEKSFTLSAEGDKNLDAAVKYLAKSGRVKEAKREFDAECDMTFVYLELS